MMARPIPRFETAVLSEPGGRSENQDCADWRQAGVFHCWALADGLGGHRGGALAARMAVEAALEAFVALPGCTPKLVRGCLGAAHAAVRAAQLGDPRLRDMRSTLVVLAADASSAAWGHIGDTRLYRLQAGRIATQTRDHSVPQKLADAGEIPLAAIRFHEDRSRLLRCLGAGESLRPSVLDKAAALSPDDAFLLCTDGFWEYVSEDQMESDFAASGSAVEWIERMTARVESAAAPDHDNYSAFGIRSTLAGR